MEEEKVRNIEVENKIRELLLTLGANLEDPNFKDTPRRYYDVLREFFKCGTDIEDELVKFGRAKFPFTGKDLIIVKDTHCFGLCPHHLLPVKYNISICYIPHGFAIGLSKITRLATVLACFPKLQEQLTEDIAENMVEYLKAEDVMVVVKGWHLCVEMRGAKNSSTMTTSAVRGGFQKLDLKTEALRLMDFE